MERGAVDLAEAGGGDGLGGNIAIGFPQGAIEFALDDFKGEVGGEGGELVLEFDQLFEEIGMDEVGAGGEGLADFNKGGAELGEDMAKFAGPLGFVAVLGVEPMVKEKAEGEATEEDEDGDGATDDNPGFFPVVAGDRLIIIALANGIVGGKGEGLTHRLLNASMRRSDGNCPQYTKLQTF